MPHQHGCLPSEAERLFTSSSLLSKDPQLLRGEWPRSPYRRPRLQHCLPSLSKRSVHNCLELYRETRARNSELGHKHHVDLCALDEAEIYLELNLLGECVDLAKAAYSGFRDRGLTLESARALTILAIAENRQGKTFLALELLAQAQDLFRQEGNDLWVGVIALYRATVYSRVGRSFEGRQLAQVADGSSSASL